MPASGEREVLVLIGCGEHARVVMDAASEWTLGGYIDRAERAVSIRWLGTEEAYLASFSPGPTRFILGFAGVKFSPGRVATAERFEARGAEFVAVVHPRAIVSPSAVIEPGAVVMAGAIVNAGARIGRHAVVNTGAVVEHDVVLGPFASVAPGVVVGGGTTIGRGTYVGLGARVRDHLTIGDEAMVGMGAVVVGDVASHATVVGVPARSRE